MKIESLKFEGVSFAHEGQDPVIQNVEFDFPVNEILWVKAEEGAGKSSLLQILGGLQIPQSGQYLINGQNVCEMSFEEFLPYRLENI
jgi:ABC-type multidrug transport system fused ATPase/permease subunit